MKLRKSKIKNRWFQKKQMGINIIRELQPGPFYKNLVYCIFGTRIDPWELEGKGQSEKGMIVQDLFRFWANLSVS